MQVNEISNSTDIEWDESRDAVAAAPEHHRVIFENEYVRVLDSRIKPGETVPLHTHRWPSIVYTLENSDFVRTDAESGRVLDSRSMSIEIEIDSAISLPPVGPHSVKNVGSKEIRAISVEIKA